MEPRTLEIHYGGFLKGNPISEYYGGKISYADNVDPDLMSIIELWDMLQGLGLPKESMIYYTMPIGDISNGLKLVEGDNAVLDMLKCHDEFGEQLKNNNTKNEVQKDADGQGKKDEGMGEAPDRKVSEMVEENNEDVEKDAEAGSESDSEHEWSNFGDSDEDSINDSDFCINVNNVEEEEINDGIGQGGPTTSRPAQAEANDKGTKTAEDNDQSSDYQPSDDLDSMSSSDEDGPSRPKYPVFNKSRDLERAELKLVAVVEAELKDSWNWFLTNLLQAIGPVEAHGWTFISDRQKGLVEVFDGLLPGVDHRFCVQHMYNNFKEQFKGKVFKDLLWEAATSYTVQDWEKSMQKIKDANVAAYEWLMKVPPRMWTRAYFRPDIKCDLLCNNMCEAWNRTILDARELPIIDLMEKIRRQILSGRLRSAVSALSTLSSLFGCCFGFAHAYPAIRGCPDASGGEHGDRWSVLITVLTSLWINSVRLALFGAIFPDCALFAKLRVAPALPTVSHCAPDPFAEIEESISMRFSAKFAERTRFRFGFLPTSFGCSVSGRQALLAGHHHHFVGSVMTVGPDGVPVWFRDFRRITTIGLGNRFSWVYFGPSLGPVDVLLQLRDRRDSCTGGYFDPTSVQWCTLGAGLSASCRWMIFEHTTLIATAGTHFTNTSGLIHRKRVFFSEKVVGLPTREPRGFIARVYASDPGASLRGSGTMLLTRGLHCEARLGTFELIVILLAFIGLRYPLGGETCLHVLTSPTIFQVSRAVRVETRREVRV
uniref:PB1-like domain-containing protein n=1 Tax=Ananas comosus var. bracteatus TaxID=296719 RepID=A0A6V7PGF3_ANACO|nr:unnamed protein product [Ananas comosus var. bracteatus]